MAAAAAAALAAPAVKRRGKDDKALLNGEIGLVGSDRRRGFVGHVAGGVDGRGAAKVVAASPAKGRRSPGKKEKGPWLGKPRAQERLSRCGSLGGNSR